MRPQFCRSIATNSSIIYEAEDCTVGLFDADGHTISIGLGLPMFIRGLSDAIKAKIAHWGKENIAPGDILLTNDGYVMGSHLNHMIFTLPIFHDGEMVAFSASMAHWPDVGGMLGGVTRDIYAEFSGSSTVQTTSRSNTYFLNSRRELVLAFGRGLGVGPEAVIENLHYRPGAILGQGRLRQAGFVERFSTGVRIAFYNYRRHLRAEAGIISEE